MVSRDYILVMQKVGIREIKAHLSAYLSRVAEGETIYVTKHGAVVAELRQPSTLAPTGHSGINALIRTGKLGLAKPNPPADLYDPIPGPGLDRRTVLDLLDAARDERRG